ncbi:MAG: Gfo/Idh/MocA family oxidoreductase [Anaerolineaceae bacterium]|nr:Gfo/Idh/MocA family oxidoreductase [Anaerolineaceae bacterium]
MKKEKMTALLVGCGGISDAWLKANQTIDELEIIGLIDLNLSAAQQRKEAHSLAEAYTGTDMKTVIDAAHPDIVFDCTVPGAHMNVATTAMEMGCNVFGEKPLADSLDNARKIVGTMQKTDRVHAVMQNRRYLAGSRRMQAFLKNGEIGSLTTLNADFYLGAHFGGFRDRMEHVLLLDMAIHTLDLGRMLVNANPISVYCKEWNPTGSWYDHDASAIAIFEFDNGVVFTYRGSWCAEGLNTSWESDWRAIGTKGSVLWDGNDEFKVETVKATGGFISELEVKDMPPMAEGTLISGHEGAIRSFVLAMLNDERPETIATDNFKSLAMVMAAIESAETGQPVKIQTLD